MRAFEATTLIDAPAERVWRILTDGAAYPSWDSGVTRVDGRIADGERITVPLAGVMFRQIPDLGPSFERFVNGVKQRAEAG